MIQTRSYTDTKICNRCHELHSKSDFNPNPHFSDGLHGHCRDCQEKTRRECEALIAERTLKLKQRDQTRSPEEVERMRQRNLQYRRTYLNKKKALDEQALPAE